MSTDGCRACGSTELSDFFAIEGIPVDVGILLDDPEAARCALRGDVTLAYCHACGFAFNRIHDPGKVVFEPGYDAYLVHSPVFRDFLDGVADRLIERFDLHGKTILEIGCGTGYFLELLCARGGNHGVGLDPALREERDEPVGEGGVRLIRDRFSIRYLDVEPDFICCQSVFEDISEPGRFLAELRQAIGERPIGVYFEVFNAFAAFRNRETWSINYEQCNYFGLDAFAGLFRRSGFDVLEADECYQDGQYIYVDAVPGAVTQGHGDGHHDLPAEAREFGEQHRRSMRQWRRRFAAFAAAGRRVVVWGSGCKGINFVNAADISGAVEYVIDINPSRQDRYIPCSAQRVASPAFLTGYRPDVIVITNALYEQEIREQVAGLGVECEFLIA